MKAEIRLRAAGCPKLNLQVHNTKVNVIEFYKKIGYRLDDVVSFGKHLEPN
jgi:ribosomal protein S18 acetylase RimI-like enzyme